MTSFNTHTSKRGQRPKRTKYRFPWRTGNRFRLLVDGPEFFPVMLEAISTAQHYVALEMYLFESGKVAGRFIHALVHAAVRGVEVFVLLDDYGSMGLLKRDRARLTKAGVHLAFYNPLIRGHVRRNLFRDHRKLLLVDGEIAYTGGAGVTDDFGGKREGHHWHDVMLEIKGPTVEDWAELFEEVWAKWGEPDRPPGFLSTSAPIEPAPGEQIGRVVTSRGPTRSEVTRSFINNIRKARERVWLSSAYFVPSRKLRRALRRSAHHGIDVRILLPGPHTDHPYVRHISRRYYSRLLRNGVRIFEYQPRFLHAKILLCDNLASLGSSNMDRWNLRWNLEANQEVEDAEFAAAVANQLTEDFGHCQEILYDRWIARPWHRRFREWYWGYFASALSWLSYTKYRPSKREQRP